MRISKTTLASYPSLVAELTIGKRLPEAVYLHADALSELSAELQTVVQHAAALASREWNVLKLALDAPRVSLLLYPEFATDSFPALKASAVIDLISGQVTHRTYDTTNPPILHRKELLLPKNHALIPAAAALTRHAEELGLFEDAHTIGHRQAWGARLARLQLHVVDHKIVSVPAPVAVERHKTALTRYSLSTPMQALWRHGFLDGTQTVFDYGCGRGDDLRVLQAEGVDALGWDPHYAPENPRRKSSVVNLGFVLNVIEDPRERAEALHNAWALAERLLVVSVLIGGRSMFERYRLFSDGVLTSRNTFQRYFTAAEFRECLEAELGREPIMLAPGIAFVFRSDPEEQAFFARRASRHPLPFSSAPAHRSEMPSVAPRAERLPRERKPKAPSKWEANGHLVDAFWQRCLELGRPPESDEFGRSNELRELFGAPITVLKKIVRDRGSAELDAARRERRDDLLVFLALNLFERRKSFGTLPDSIQRSVKAFFGSYQVALEEAQRLLFSAGRTENVRGACVEASAKGLGVLQGDHDLQLHASLVSELPGVLRVYLGCATRLYGDIENADVVKIHIQSGKLTLMTYDDFHMQPLPRLIERVKINLRRQEISFFEYGTDVNNDQLLYLKSRFLRPGFANYEAQREFDRQLLALGLFTFEGFGPTRDEFLAGLARANVRVDGFHIIRG